MGHKMLKGEVAIGPGEPLYVYVVTSACPLRQEQIGIIPRCVRPERPLCEHFAGFSTIKGTGCIRCAHPDAEDAKEFGEWLERQRIEVAELGRGKPRGRVSDMALVDGKWID